MKQYKKILIAILSIGIVATVVYAAGGIHNIPQDRIRFGGGDNSANKEIKFDRSGPVDPILRYNTSTNKFQFSNDGSFFADFGSGGGGSGVNFLELDNANPGFEAGTPPNSWTSSGGTFTAETTDAGFDLKSGRWDASALSQTLRSSDVNVTKGLELGYCLAQGKYKYTGSLGDISVRVERGDNTILSGRLSLSDSGGIWTTFNVPFICPANTFDVRIVFEAEIADPAFILLDEMHLGSDVREVEISQATTIFHGYYPTTASCQWDVVSTSPAAFTTDTDCPSITSEFSSVEVNTADNDLPDVVFPSLPPGVYQVEVKTAVTNTGTSRWAGIAINDGSSTRGVAVTRTESALGGQVTAISSKAIFSYTDPAARTFSVYGFGNAGTTNMSNQTNNERLTITVTRYPNDVESSIQKPDTQGALIRAYHEADCDYGNQTSTTYVDGVGDATCTFTVERASGFSGVATMDVAGNDIPGIKFTVPYTGDFMVCVNHAMLGATINEAYSSRLLVDNLTSIAEINFRQAGPGGSVISNLCGVLQANEVKEYTVKIQGRGTSGLHSLAEVTPTNGPRSADDWTVYPLTQQFPEAVLLSSFDPTKISSASSATKMGLYKYEHGGTYFAGGAPTVTLSAGGGTLSSVDIADFFPYQVNDGSWRLKGNIRVTVSSVARTAATFSVAGVVFDAAAQQTFAGLVDASPASERSFVDPSTDDFQFEHSSVSSTLYAMSFDVALNAKPTWAF